MLDDLHYKLRHGYLIKYARVGRRILKGKPGGTAAFKVPGKRARGATLLGFAKTMAKFIQDDMELFYEEEMPRDFLVRLRAATRKFGEVLRTIEIQIDRQKKATVLLAKEVPLAREDVNILDGLLNERKKEPDGLATAWAQAKRVGKRMGPPRGGKWKWDTTKVQVK